jgi:metal-responsive CopG/Arc/MetJ family transcriptional regulator
MALRNVQRVTFSIPVIVVKKLSLSVPKNKRSKFVAEAIIKNLSSKTHEVITLEEVHAFWDNLANRSKRKTNKTAVELVREDRLSH